MTTRTVGNRGEVRVLVFEPECGGHYFQWVAVLLKAFLSRHDQVSLATSAHAVESQEYREYLGGFAGRVTVLTIPQPSARFASWHRRLRHVYNAIQLVRIARREQPELLVVPYLDAMLIPLGLLHLCGLGFDRRHGEVEVVLMRGEFAYPEIRGKASWRFHPKWRFKEWIVRRALRAGWFSRVLVLDEITYRHMLGWRRGATQLRLCPEPVSASFPDRRRARQELGIEETAKIVGCWGVLDARKGVDVLLRAFAARPRRPDERLLLAGRQHPAIAALWAELLARDESLAERVIVSDRFLSMAEMKLHVAATDVAAVLYPAHVGGSRVLIEAVAAGKPVLASSFGWVGQVVREKRLGRVCDVQSAEDLSRGLDWAYGTPSFDAESAAGFVEWNSIAQFRQVFLEPFAGRREDAGAALCSVAEGSSER